MPKSPMPSGDDGKVAKPQVAAEGGTMKRAQTKADKCVQMLTKAEIQPSETGPKDAEKREQTQTTENVGGKM